jgi:hypothetical protein
LLRGDVDQLVRLLREYLPGFGLGSAFLQGTLSEKPKEVSLPNRASNGTPHIVIDAKAQDIDDDDELGFSTLDFD